MMDGELRDHELVVHAFAPLYGPDAQAAAAQVRDLWARSQSLLGTSLAVAGTGLPTTVPKSPAAMPQGAVAAQENDSGDFRLILRRVDDALNLSMVFAAPPGSAAPGWIEFDRWWAELAAGGTGALLGTNHVYQARAGGDGTPSPQLAGAVTAALPLVDDALRRGERLPVRRAGFTVWELADDRGPGPRRRIVVVAPAGHDAELGAWSWSRAGVAVPPLASYLLHAATIRDHARSWNDGSIADRVRLAVDHGVGRLRAALSQPGRPGLSAARREVLATLTDLATADGRIREMRTSVERARAELYGCLAEPLPADRDLADRLLEQLADALAYLDVSRRHAAEVSATAYNGQSYHPPADSVPLRLPVDGPAEPIRPRIAVRMGFAVDIVGYSPRPAPLKDEAQGRLSGIVIGVLADLELALAETDHQDSGDGMNLFLPPEVEMHRALPELLRSWRHRVAADNDEHADRLRLRLAVGVGPVGLAALGFGGNTIIEVSRLLDSDAIRAAVRRHPERDLVVLVSDQLYRWVVGEGHPGLDATAFERVEASAKQFAATAWLWSH